MGIDEVVVIDPGPDDPGHIDAIIGASMPERVRLVALTHTHPDHWPAAVTIAKRCGARIVGHPKVPKIDGDVPIDDGLDEGDTIDGTEFQLTTLFTPGHAPNHLCFLLEEERVVFTGDHVLSGTTTVINPERGGDMTLYLESLERLRAMRRINRICPGHGDVIEDPAVVLGEYVAHRKMREKQIVKALRDEPARIPDLVTRIYSDVPEVLIEWAQRQVHAHLLKLKAERIVEGRSFKSTWQLSR